ncbi:type IV pilus biogenesis protein PilM [Chengkuizengella sp. SCS-71B]|uniref:type IV pilus biogenesis protein PilM n=1 Tax=Chengkuizengella sp. SCS-71B TaxID=3115290 RepID=UPI0032C2453A
MTNIVEYLKRKLVSLQCFIGVEMTDEYIKLVEIKMDKNNSFIIHQYKMEPIQTNLIKDGFILNTNEVINKLNDMLKQLTLYTNQVHFMLPSHLVHLHFLTVPHHEKEKILKWIQTELENERIELPFKNPHFDMIKLSTDTTGKTNIMLLTAPQDEIETYVNVFNAVNLKPISLEIKAFSLFRLIHALELIDIMCSFIVIEINKFSAEISVFQSGILQTIRSIPVMRSPEKYRSVKTAAQKAVSFKIVKKNEGDLSSYLTLEVKKFINYYHYYDNNKNKEDFQCLILLGDISELHQIGYEFNRAFPFEVRILNADERISNDKNNNLLPFFAVPLGLALRGRH